MAKTLVIIPTYNEQETIERTIDAVLESSIYPDILVVDDSNDLTGDIVAAKAAVIKRVNLLKRKTKSGRGTAVLEGIRYGLDHDYTYLIEMDADFSHDPEELPKLLAASTPNALVVGSRYLPQSRIVNWPLRRRIFSRCANLYAIIILRIGIRDYTNGYRVYHRDIAQKIRSNEIRSTGYIVLSEVAYQLFLMGVRFIEVPTVFVNRKNGTSNISLNEIWESLVSVARIRFKYLRRSRD